MKWFLNLPQWARLGIAIPLAIAGFIAVGYMYKTGPQASELVWNEEARQPTLPIVVDYEPDEFDKPIYHSILFWNDIMPTRDGARGQDLFVAGTLDDAQPGESVVRIMGANGDPCPGAARPANTQDGHTATTWQCPPNADGVLVWEVHISKPGNIRTQLCIVAHELGHVLGLADDGKHNLMVMNQFYCPDVDQGVIRVSDKDKAALIKRFDTPANAELSN